jgi:thioredoxin-dependent peroxiredoxin
MPSIRSLSLAALLALLACTAVRAGEAPPGATPAAPAAPSGPALPEAGQGAPDFTLPSSAGGKVHLKKLRGHVVVLYFYPKDETPGCTHEACDFRDHNAELEQTGVRVFGVSNDDLASHRHFVDKEHLPFPLLADVDATVSRRYGVLRERERDGRKVTGIARTTFVISADGRIARVWPNVDVNGHADEVVKFVAGR